MLGIGLLVLVVACVLLVTLFLGPRDSGEVSVSLPTPTSEAFESIVQDTPTTPPEIFVPPSTSSEGQTWLVMLYQDADDKMLEQDIYVDLNEAERVGSSERVHIVAQVFPPPVNHLLSERSIIRTGRAQIASITAAT